MKSRHSKWKMSRGESFFHKLNKPRSFRKLSRIESYAILGLVLTSFLFIIPAGVYYNDYLPNWRDPFTTLWRGSTPPRHNTTITEYIYNNDSYFISGAGLIEDAGECFVATGVNFPGLKVDFATMWLRSPFDVSANTYRYDLYDLNGTTTGNVGGMCKPISLGLVASSVTFSGSLIQTVETEITAQFTGGGRPHILTGHRYSIVLHYVSGGASPAVYARSSTGNGNLPTGNAFYCVTNIPDCNDSDGADVNFRLSSWSNCPQGFNCINTVVDKHGNIILEGAQTDYAPVAISNVSIEFGTASGKSLSLYFAMRPFSWTGTSYGTADATQFAWFLTRNSTVPLVRAAAYNPLNDPNVDLVFIKYTNATVSGLTDNYLYMRRNYGGTLLGASALGVEPPMDKCTSQVSVMFLCARTNATYAGGKMILDLNFTGTTSTYSGQPNTGASYMCTDASSGGQSCIAGGSDSDGTVFFAGTQDKTKTRTFPWLNIASTAYHVGLWNMGNSVGFVNSTNTLDDNVFTNRIQIVTPNPCATLDVNGCVKAETQPEGFLGWLGRTIGGAFSIAGNALGDVFGPALNIAGSIMGAVFAAFVQAVSFLVEGYRIILNIIGNLVGLGNLGDAIVGFFTTIANAIIQGFSALVAGILVIGTFITQGYLAFVAGIFVLATTLFPFLFILWRIVISGTFTVTQILFLDYVVGMFMVLQAIEQKKSSLKAFLGWIALNVFIATFVIEAVNYVFMRFIDPIRKSKQTIDPLG